MRREEPLETIEFDGGVYVQIFPDECCASDPRDWDNVSVMVCWHRRYKLGDDHKFDTPQEWALEMLRGLNLSEYKGLRKLAADLLREDRWMRNEYRNFMEGLNRDQRDDYLPDFLEETVKTVDVISLMQEQGYVVKPLYMYDHSGITIATGTTSFHAVDPVGWDWGQLGWVYASPSRAREMGMPPERMEEAVDAEVEEYRNFVEGSVYCIVVSTPDDECVESVGGVIGWEAAMEEAESMGKFLSRKYTDLDRFMAEGI